MKTLITIIVLIGISSCQMSTKRQWNISSKVLYTSGGTPSGVCKYKITDGDNWEYTEDSCNKYNVGDTVKH